MLFQLPEQHSVLLRLEDTWWTAWDRSWVKRLCLSMESPVAFDSGATDLELSSNVRLAHALLYGVDDPLSKVKAVPAHGSHYSFNASGNRCQKSVVLMPPFCVLLYSRTASRNACRSENGVKFGRMPGTVPVQSR